MQQWLALKRVHDARREADAVISAMRNLKDNSAQDLILMRNFVSTLFQGYEKRLLDKFIAQSEGGKLVKHNLEYIIWTFAQTAVIGGLWAYMLYYIVSQYANMRSARTIQLFFLIVGVSLAEDIFIFRTVVVWVECVFSTYLLTEKLRSTLAQLAAVSRVVLIRSSGMMKHSNGYGECNV